MDMELPPPGRARDEIARWLVDWIAAELQMPAAGIDPTRSLLDYSMSSVTATILVGDLEDWLSLRLPPTLVWDFPSIDEMAVYLLAETRAQRTAVAAPGAGAPDAGQLLDSLDQLSDAEVEALLNQLSAAEPG